MADEAYAIGPARPAQSYLKVEALLDAAKKGKATLVHPGYGFLSENADFARAVAEAGLTFIGPPPEAMTMMGDKSAARRAAERIGVPVVPGTPDPVDVEHGAKEAERIGFPLAVKAAFGGGGKGMRVVHDPKEVGDALERAAREAGAYFGRPEVYLERYIEVAHHVEAQILADEHGNVSFLGERDCSLQRRHQKLVEEAPAPGLPAAVRAEMARAATAISKAAGYTNAGTIEFLYEPATEKVYFLEMNTRLQVEHPVTELVSGIDIVAAQLRVAAGERLPGILGPDWEHPAGRGHAIEVRINAEDPGAGFMPAPGLVTTWKEPSGPWVRVDAGVVEGFTIPQTYDSLMAKLIV